MAEFWFLKSIKNLIRDQRGMVAVFALMVLIMIAVWGAATLTLSTNEYRISNTSQKAIQAYYLAEAGLEEGIAKLVKDPENLADFSLTLETGDCEVSHSGEIPGTVMITSVGKVEDFKKTLTARLDVELTGSGITNNQAIGSYGNVDLTVIGGATIWGDVLYNGNLKVSGSNRINGSVYCNGYFEIAGGSTISGNVNSKNGLKLISTGVSGAVYTDGEVDHNWDASINGQELHNPPDPKYSAINSGGFAIFSYIPFEVPPFPPQYQEEWYLPSWGSGYLLTPENGFIDSLPQLPEGKSYYLVPDGTILTGTIHKPGAVIVSNGKIEFNNRYWPTPKRYPDFDGLTIVAEKIEINAYDSLKNCTIYGKSSLVYGGISGNSRTVENNRNIFLISHGDITIPGGFGFEGGILSEGQVNVGGGTSIRGSIYGREVSFGGIELIYDSTILQSISWPFLSKGYKITIKDWN